MKGKKYCGGINDIKFSCPNCKEKYFFPIKSYDRNLLEDWKKQSSFSVSCPWCYNGPGRTGSITIDLNNPKESYGDLDAVPDKRGLYDCLYFEEDYAYAKEFSEKITAKFPTVKLEDASDSIHGKRLAVNLEGVYNDEYIMWMCLEGDASLSLTIGLIIQDSKCTMVSRHDRDILLKAIEIIKARG